MANSLITHINFVSRAALAFVFIYHGFFPKIFFLSPIEISLTNAHNLGVSPALMALIAGVCEIVLGLLVVLLNKTLVPIYIAITILVVLLCDVAFMMPQFLVEAFNPVTINMVSIVMGYFVIITQQTHKK